MDPSLIAALIAGVGTMLGVITAVILSINQARRNEKVIEKRQEVQIEQIAKAKPENIQEVAASQLGVTI